MKILLFGVTGMLGHKLLQVLGPKFNTWATVRGSYSGISSYDIFDPKTILENVTAEDFESVKKAIEDLKPDVVINAVGIIKQVPSSNDIVKTLEINSIFPHRLAELAEIHGCRLISISTDCVFDGERGNYTEDDLPNANDLYGKSKNLGEVTGQNCLTIRTSIIGRELETSHSLLEWFLSQKGKTIQGYANAVYSGFPTIVFAAIIADLISNHKDLQGLYHISSEPISKFDLLNLINDEYNAGVRIEPFDDFRLDRSLDSTKFKTQTGFTPKSWKEMVVEMAADPTPYDKWRK